MEQELFIVLARKLEDSGLYWYPEIGDEVVERTEGASISVLVDSQGLTPGELRTLYLWLPTVEQMLEQIELRSGILFHAGRAAGKTCYEAMVFFETQSIASKGETLRLALADVLCSLIAADFNPTAYH